MKNYEPEKDYEQSNRPLLNRVQQQSQQPPNQQQSSINDSSIRAVNDGSDKSPNQTDLNDVSVLIKDPRGGSGVPVTDRYLIVYGIFLLFGIAVLLPWNIFITATDYFVKFKLNDTEHGKNAYYTQNFTFIVGLVGQMTNVIMNLVNILATFGGNPKKRIPWTVMLCAIVIVFQIALAIVDSSKWPLTFFILCCVSVFVMYVATGILNSCVYYVASIFPMEYLNAIVLGNNLSGVFTTLMSIISKASTLSSIATPNYRLAAIFYFLSAFIVLMLAFIGYFLMPRMKFYRHYAELAEMRTLKNEAENQNKPVKVPYWQLIKQTWLLLFCIWLNFFSTLAIFPVYQLGIQRASDSFFINDIWYQDIITFLTFNILVTIGNLVPKLFRRPGPKWLPVPVIARAILVFIFFSLCNFQPEKRANSIIPILIKNDYVYWAGCFISPLFFGYFTSLLMMYTPTQVPEQFAGSIAMVAAFLITVGVTTGLQFTKVFELIVLGPQLDTPSNTTTTTTPAFVLAPTTTIPVSN